MRRHVRCANVHVDICVDTCADTCVDFLVDHLAHTFVQMRVDTQPTLMTDPWCGHVYKWCGHVYKWCGHEVVAFKAAIVFNVLFGQI